MTVFRDNWQATTEIAEFFAEPVVWIHGSATYQFSAVVRRLSRNLSEEEEEFEGFAANAEIRVDLENELPFLLDDPDGHRGDRVEISVSLGSNSIERYLVEERRDLGDGWARFTLTRMLQEQRTVGGET